MKVHDVPFGIVVLLIGVYTVGCATVVTRDADLEAVPDGIRVFPPRVCLLVDSAANGGEGSTVIAYLPDVTRAYDIKPLTVLAKQEFRLDVDEGQVKGLVANQDTTAFLTFLGQAAELAAKTAGAGVSASAPMRGSFGFSAGVHCMGDDGRFARGPGSDQRARQESRDGSNGLWRG